MSRFTFQFDGEPIEAVGGQTIAAALMAAERRAFRRTRGADRPRGLYCGIGVCFDCLVVVNGVPSQRACLVEVRPGDRIEAQEATGWPQ